MRKQRQWAEMDPSLISDEEILREAALPAEDPPWDDSVPLGRLKSFFGKKVCELYKEEVCFCIGTVLSILTAVVVVEGEASAVKCAMLFSLIHATSWLFAPRAQHHFQGFRH